RNLVTGLPAQVKLTDYDIYKAIIDIANEMIDAVKGVLEVTPPELAGDIHSNGIILTGGGALIGGLDKLIEQETKIHTYCAEDPLRCVARGTSLAFKHLDTLLDGFEKISLYGYSEI
ncbi:MAG: rod shape-determining protein, partial [Huintestinicola sp.]